MAYHLARSAKRKEEHPVCGAALLDTQFKGKIIKNISYNKIN